MTHEKEQGTLFPEQMQHCPRGSEILKAFYQNLKQQKIRQSGGVLLIFKC